MKRPATRGGVAGAAARGAGDAKARPAHAEEASSGAEPAVASPRGLEPSDSRAAAGVPRRLSGTKAYNAGHGHGVPSYREYARSHFLATQRAQDLEPEALRQNLAGRGRP